MAFFVVNEKLCIEFYKSTRTFKYRRILCLLVHTSTSAVLFVAINFSSSFRAEKTGNGEIAAQQILACFTVGVHMCMLIGENTVCVACGCPCARLQSTE